MIPAYLYDKEIDSKGTWFKCYVPEELKEEYLERMQRDDGLWEIGVNIYDPRKISNNQRRLLYALFRDIGNYTGDAVMDVKENLKIEFMVDCEKDYFSLSDTDVTTAREFTEYILAFMFNHDIPFNIKILPLVKEVNNYLYLCLVHRKCAVCGKKGAQIHHVDAVGAGRDRTKIDHTQHRLIALCANHHEQAHKIGWLTFSKRYIVDGIRVTEETVKKLGI